MDCLSDHHVIEHEAVRVTKRLVLETLTCGTCGEQVRTVELSTA
ncbi:hypothetical protein CLV28_1744 [Sediminihabitans luteus]|uniref:Uncharacterized protein n=1 Tax=Sediminihabitans luteus TaxID=1138585 RepID=A0A2M9CQN4_9CELL|nr:hypothetical protein [Sediminihabitans luteus]PJJ74250.1 hypothetical protein CLV28_1744 [Sediminihabitans luteus]GII99103.1 hypothetical protein Slu03_14810 [Sediminihabitans luteus]